MNIYQKTEQRNFKSLEVHVLNCLLFFVRHTYATRCIEARASRCNLKKLLRHSNIYITLNTYVNVFDKNKIMKL